MFFGSLTNESEVKNGLLSNPRLRNAKGRSRKIIYLCKTNLFRGFLGSLTDESEVKKFSFSNPRWRESKCQPEK